jgi:dTDP-4-dehydrorhamnose reductase
VNILVLGGRGMLGRDLVTVLSGRPERHRVTAWDIEDIDIIDKYAVDRALGRDSFEVVVNCAAYTAVDKAEQDKETALAVNARGARNVAAAARAAGSRNVLLSTDYVFDGSKQGAYREDDEPCPANYYGYTKLMGERLTGEVDPDCLIVRTQWLYGAAGKNFVETMLKLAETNKPLSVVDDQQGSPTWTADLARAIALLVEGRCRGIYHVSNAGWTTWCGFARKIFETAQKEIEVIPITTEQFNAPARRPANSIFDMTRLLEDTGYAPPHWTEALGQYLTMRGRKDAR